VPPPVALITWCCRQQTQRYIQIKPIQHDPNTHTHTHIYIYTYIYIHKQLHSGLIDLARALCRCKCWNGSCAAPRHSPLAHRFHSERRKRWQRRPASPPRAPSGFKGKACARSRTPWTKGAMWVVRTAGINVMLRLRVNASRLANGLVRVKTYFSTASFSSEEKRRAEQSRAEQSRAEQNKELV
jgi:hypothetical protein